MTRNIKLYVLFSVLWSIAFFAVLNWGLHSPDNRWVMILLAGVTYGVGFGVMGYLLGKYDNQKKVRYSLGHAYSAVSNIVSAIVGSLWIIFYKPGETWSLAIYLPIIGLVALLGFINYKKSIKGMNNRELFQ